MGDTVFAACEDLDHPGGALALVSSTNQIEWFTKGYDMYGSSPTGNDDDFYLNFTKQVSAFR